LLLGQLLAVSSLCPLFFSPFVQPDQKAEQNTQALIEPIEATMACLVNVPIFDEKGGDEQFIMRVLKPFFTLVLSNKTLPKGENILKKPHKVRYEFCIGTVQNVNVMATI
jgi:hypothetical protein